MLRSNLEDKVAGLFTEATKHTTTNVTDKGLKYALSIKANSVVSIGGGSTIRLGKAISTRTGLLHMHSNHVCRVRGDANIGRDGR
jgi:alcohol dehydrogenase class IV